MKEKEILECNKLIADFIGWELNDIGCYGYFRQFGKFLHNPITGNDRSYNPEQLAFHLSWDWLMPVIEKCYSDKENDKMSELTEKFDFWKIDLMFDAVVKYIKWHNENNK